VSDPDRVWNQANDQVRDDWVRDDRVWDDRVPDRAHGRRFMRSH
jgi:hypothetical protein